MYRYNTGMSFNPLVRIARDFANASRSIFRTGFNPLVRIARDVTGTVNVPTSGGFNPLVRIARDDSAIPLDRLWSVSIHSCV